MALFFGKLIDRVRDKIDKPSIRPGCIAVSLPVDSLSWSPENARKMSEDIVSQSIVYFVQPTTPSTSSIDKPASLKLKSILDMTEPVWFTYESFTIVNRCEAFYTGGQVQASSDGEHILCQCGTKVNGLQVDTGVVSRSIGQEASELWKPLELLRRGFCYLGPTEDDVDITYFLLSPDDQILVTANVTLVLRHWNWKEQNVIRTWKSMHIAPVTSMGFDPTSTLLATGSADSTVKVWDMIKQYCTHNLRGHEGVVSIVQFHPDISRLQLFTAADDYKIRVWSLQTSSCLALLEGHLSVVTSLQFKSIGDELYSTEQPLATNNDSQQYFIVGGSLGELKVWNAFTSKCVHPRIKSYDPTNQNICSQIENIQSNAITAVFYIKKRDAVCAVTLDRNILLYNMQDLHTNKQFVGHNDDILDIKFLGCDDNYIAVATNSALIKVFEVNTWTCQILSGHTDIVVALDVYEKNNLTLLVSGSKDNSIRVWLMDPVTCHVHCIAVGYGHTHTVGAVVFSRLSPKFVVSASTDLTLKMWPLVWSKPLNDSETEVKQLLLLEGAKDGVVTQITSEQTEKAHDKDINCITVSPNDSFIATGSQDKTLKLWSWDVALRSGVKSTLKVVGVFRGHKRGVWCVQFSKFDQILASSSADTTIKLWDIRSFACLLTLEGHESSVLRVDFLSRGLQLVSSGSDGMLKLWSIKDTECIKTFVAHEEKVWAMCVDKKEDRIVTGAGDSSIVLWKDATEAELEEARMKREDILLKEQELSNLMQQKNYLKALALTIVMDQPFKALNIIKAILKSNVGTRDLEVALDKLRTDQLDAVLKFAVAWNTNSKNCHAAQAVLSVLLKKLSADQLLAFPDIQSIVEGLLPYTERHYERMNQLVQKTTFVDYIWQTMRLAADNDSSQTVEEPMTTEEQQDVNT